MICHQRTSQQKALPTGGARAAARCIASARSAAAQCHAATHASGVWCSVGLSRGVGSRAVHCPSSPGTSRPPSMVGGVGGRRADGPAGALGWLARGLARAVKLGFLTHYVLGPRARRPAADGYSTQACGRAARLARPQPQRCARALKNHLSAFRPRHHRSCFM